MDDQRRPVARLSTVPGAPGPWAPIALMRSHDTGPPMIVVLGTDHPEPDPGYLVFDAAVREADPEVEVAVWHFDWQGPPGLDAAGRWSLEAWFPVPDTDPGTEPGAENWHVLWVPIVRLDTTTVASAGIEEIAFTTEGTERVTAPAPPIPAVPPHHRGRPVDYRLIQHTTTERPPAERNATGA